MPVKQIHVDWKDGEQKQGDLWIDAAIVTNNLKMIDSRLKKAGLREIKDLISTDGEGRWFDRDAVLGAFRDVLDYFTRNPETLPFSDMVMEMLPPGVSAFESIPAKTQVRLTLDVQKAPRPAVVLPTGNTHAPPTGFDKIAQVALVSHVGTFAGYISKWDPQDQKWWESLPAQLGEGRYRLYLTGMLRAAFMQDGRVDNNILKILEIAERYAEQGDNWDQVIKKHDTVSNWKLGRNPMWGGLLCVLQPVCTSHDGEGVLYRLEYAFEWKQAELIAAAKQWLRSLESPLTGDQDWQAAWCTPKVVALAKRMRKERSYLEIQELGSLLEKAGCQSPAILEHCQDPERRHMHGDWLISAILKTAP